MIRAVVWWSAQPSYEAIIPATTKLDRVPLSALEAAKGMRVYEFTPLPVLPPPRSSANRGKLYGAPFHKRTLFGNPGHLKCFFHAALLTDVDIRISTLCVPVFRSPQHASAPRAAAMLLRLMGAVPIQRHLRFVLCGHLMHTICSECG